MKSLIALVKIDPYYLLVDGIFVGSEANENPDPS